MNRYTWPRVSQMKVSALIVARVTMQQMMFGGELGHATGRQLLVARITALVLFLAHFIKGLLTLFK